MTSLTNIDDSCGICKKELTYPVQLPCGHKFDLGCINGLKVSKCPVDNREFDPEKIRILVSNISLFLRDPSSTKRLHKYTVDLSKLPDTHMHIFGIVDLPKQNREASYALVATTRIEHEVFPSDQSETRNKFNVRAVSCGNLQFMYWNFPAIPVQALHDIARIDFLQAVNKKVTYKRAGEKNSQIEVQFPLSEKIFFFEATANSTWANDQDAVAARVQFIAKLGDLSAAKREGGYYKQDLSPEEFLQAAYRDATWASQQIKDVWSLKFLEEALEEGSVSAVRGAVHASKIQIGMRFPELVDWSILSDCFSTAALRREFDPRRMPHDTILLQKQRTDVIISELVKAGLENREAIKTNWDTFVTVMLQQDTGFTREEWNQRKDGFLVKLGQLQGEKAVFAKARDNAVDKGMDDGKADEKAYEKVEKVRDRVKASKEEEKAGELPKRRCYNPICDLGASATELLKCSKCKNAFYCNATCQKTDWPKHKKVCKAA